MRFKELYTVIFYDFFMYGVVNLIYKLIFIFSDVLLLNSTRQIIEYLKSVKNKKNMTILGPGIQPNNKPYNLPSRCNIFSEWSFVLWWSKQYFDHLVGTLVEFKHSFILSYYNKCKGNTVFFEFFPDKKLGQNHSNHSQLWLFLLWILLSVLIPLNWIFYGIICKYAIN